MFLEVWESVKEWTPTLPNELSLGELKSQWILEFSRRDCRGQNPLDWEVHYIIENLLECRCLKWAHMTHLGSWNISYGQKKGRESNWQFDSQALKVKNRPDFLTCSWRVTYRWKVFNKGYNFSWDLTSSGGSHKKLRASVMLKVLISRIRDSQLENPGTKWHLGANLVAKYKNYYKGEGGDFPQVRAMVSLVSLCLLVVHLCTKMLLLHINQLVV
jgi:hypothetical protein